MVQYKGKHDFTFYKPVSHDDAVVIPLYTHPAELTDEEIIKEALEIGFIVEQDLSYEWREYTQEFIACVKAILRKAQEK